jgi:hypothetical protein
VKRISELGKTLAFTSYCLRCSYIDDSFHPDDGDRLFRNVGSLKRCVLQLLVIDNVSSAFILSNLKMEAIRSSSTSVLTKASRRHISEDEIPHSHRRENLKSYVALTGWTL